MATPISKTKEHKMRSASVYGVKSPRPVDERVVNVKYMAAID